MISFILREWRWLENGLFMGIWSCETHPTDTPSLALTHRKRSCTVCWNLVIKSKMGALG